MDKPRSAPLERETTRYSADRKRLHNAIAVAILRRQLVERGLPGSNIAVQAPAHILSVRRDNVFNALRVAGVRLERATLRLGEAVLTGDLERWTAAVARVTKLAEAHERLRKLVDDLGQAYGPAREPATYWAAVWDPTAPGLGTERLGATVRYHFELGWTARPQSEAEADLREWAWQQQTDNPKGGRPLERRDEPVWYDDEGVLKLRATIRANFPRVPEALDAIAATVRPQP